jgi:hypothetical protein
MTVTLNYYGGPPDVFTNASYSIVGDIVTVEGTNAQGVTGTFSYHWSDIKSISQV